MYWLRSSFTVDSRECLVAFLSKNGDMEDLDLNDGGTITPSRDALSNLFTEYSDTWQEPSERRLTKKRRKFPK